jgi:hypothetical protein
MQAFVEAAKAFPEFATTSEDEVINKRELAAFLAQISHETTGGWPTAPDGPYAWGLCFHEEVSKPPLPWCLTHLQQTSQAAAWHAAPWVSGQA